MHPPPNPPHPQPHIPIPTSSPNPRTERLKLRQRPLLPSDKRQHEHVEAARPQRGVALGHDEVVDQEAGAGGVHGVRGVREEGVGVVVGEVVQDVAEVV